MVAGPRKRERAAKLSARDERHGSETEWWSETGILTSVDSRRCLSSAERPPSAPFGLPKSFLPLRDGAVHSCLHGGCHGAPESASPYGSPPPSRAFTEFARRYQPSCLWLTSCTPQSPSCAKQCEPASASPAKWLVRKSSRPASASELSWAIAHLFRAPLLSTGRG